MYDIMNFFGDLLNSGFVGIVILLFIIVWSILWIALPFYVYGIYAQNKKLNARFHEFAQKQLSGGGDDIGKQEQGKLEPS